MARGRKPTESKRHVLTLGRKALQHPGRNKRQGRYTGFAFYVRLNEQQAEALARGTTWRGPLARVQGRNQSRAAALKCTCSL